MKHKVNKAFTDKETGTLYLSGFYVSDDYERVMYLEKEGFIIANDKADSLKKVEKQEDKPKQPSKKNSTRKKASDSNARKG